MSFNPGRFGALVNQEIHHLIGPELRDITPNEATANADLAGTFYRNWIKKPGVVLDVAFHTDFAGQFDKYGCTSGTVNFGQIKNPDTTDGSADAITAINVFQYLPTAFAQKFLQDCKARLKPDGILFLRMPQVGHVMSKEDEHRVACQWDLDSFLELLDASPTFKVAETYVLAGNVRDYLLRPIEKRPTVCIGMIAKNEERDLPRCLESLEGVADGLVLCDTGSTDRTKALARQWSDNQKKTYPHFKHRVRDYFEASEKDEKGDWKLWNFGKARNEYVRLIEEMGFDYVLWMDADDQLLDKKIKNLRYLDQYVIHGVQISSGGLKWPHHRLFKTKQGVQYSGWCHEYPGWTGLDYVHKDIAIHHDAAPGAGENSNDRNLRILIKAMEQEPSARTAFYLANTYKDRGLHAEAVPAYQKRMDFGYGYEDEYWFAVLYKARCEKFAKLFDQCRRTLMYAISTKPSWAEFWMELSYLESQLGNHWEAIAWALLAKDRPIPPTQLWRENDKYNDQPYRSISWAFQSLGDIEQAIEWGHKAAEKIGGPDKDWSNRLQELHAMIYAEEKKQAVKFLKKDKRRVMWHRPGALGDVLMTLNLVKKYKEKNPNDLVIYKAHEGIVANLKEVMLLAGVDEVVPTSDTTTASEVMYNLIGYPIQEGYPEKPMQKHLLEYFAAEVGLSEVGTLHLPRRKNEFDQPYVTMHVKAGWSVYKEWPIENWEWIADKLRSHGALVVQIGGPDDPKILNARHHKLGASLLDNLYTMGNADFHVGIDSWTNHATNIEWKDKGKTPAVILWGSTQPSAAGYKHNRNLTANLPCQPCFREDPKISKNPRGPCPHPEGQVYEKPQHLCMAKLDREHVLRAILLEWENRV